MDVFKCAAVRRLCQRRAVRVGAHKPLHYRELTGKWKHLLLERRREEHGRINRWSCLVIHHIDAARQEGWEEEVGQLTAGSRLVMPPAKRTIATTRAAASIAR